MNITGMEASPVIKKQVEGNLRIPSVTKKEQRKSLDVINNGSYEVLPNENNTLSSVLVNVNVPIPDGYVKPEGTLEIIENGYYGITEKAKVDVNVPNKSWIRPEDWLPYPEMSTKYDEIWMLIHVTKDYGAACLYEIGEYTIDWGDGIVEHINGFSEMHYYDFEDLDKKSETETGHRQCWCRAYRPRNTLSGFNFGRNYFHAHEHDNPGGITVVEFVINCGAEKVTGSVYSLHEMYLLKHVKIHNGCVVMSNQNYKSDIYTEGNIVFTNNYRACNIPENNIKHRFADTNKTSANSFFKECIANSIEADFEGVTDLNSTFYRTKANRIILKNTDDCTDFSNCFYQTNYKARITGISMQNATKIDCMYQSFHASIDNMLNGIQGHKILSANDLFNDCKVVYKVPDLIMPNCTTVKNIFKNASYICEIGTLDFSSITNATGAFDGVGYLKNIRFVEESIPITLNFTQCPRINIDSAKSIILGLKNYAGTENEFDYSIQFAGATLTLLETDGATAPDGLTWIEFAQIKGWNI